MALDPTYVDPFAKMPPPQATALDKLTKGLGEGIDAFMNGLVERCGSFMDHCTSSIKGLGKASIINVEGNSFSNGDNARNFSESIAENPLKRDSTKMERSHTPELEQKVAISSPSNSKPIYQEVSMADCGNLCAPHTPYQMAATKSQGISI